MNKYDTDYATFINFVKKSAPLLSIKSSYKRSEEDDNEYMSFIRQAPNTVSYFRHTDRHFISERDVAWAHV